MKVETNSSTCVNGNCVNNIDHLTASTFIMYCDKCGSEIVNCKKESQKQFTLRDLLCKYDLEDSLWVDVDYENDDIPPSVNLMNDIMLHPNTEEGFIDLSEELIKKYMCKAAIDPDIKKVFAMLAKENIEYRFKFISVIYYN